MTTTKENEHQEPIALNGGTSSLRPPSYTNLGASPLNLQSEVRATSRASLEPPPYTDPVEVGEPPAYSAPPEVLSRSQKLRLLGLTARNDLQRALVAGNTAEAVRLCESSKRSLSSSLSAFHPGAIWGDTNPGPTDFHVAVLFGEIEVVQALLSFSDVHATFNIKATFGERTTPLHLAIAIRNFAIVRLLLDHGASLLPKKMKAKFGHKFEYYPPACIALHSWLDLTEPVQPEECIEMLNMFLTLDWDINSPVDSIARTMLHLAVQLPQDRAYLRSVMVNFLLDNGGDVLASSVNGHVALHFATRSNESPDIVAKLLQQTPTQQLSAKDVFGSTPLHAAVANRRSNASKASLDIMQALLVSGANVRERNKKGESPLSLAGDLRTSGDLEVWELFKRFDEIG